MMTRRELFGSGAFGAAAGLEQSTRQSTGAVLEQDGGETAT